ncbi:MAG: glycerate kinase [Chloroflexi bacterium]|nr:MAG: glycerate kinase [Chloroflexota bacterium]
MKILIAPGAFKHSLSATEAAQAIARGLERSGLGADVRLLPIADGGNGTLDAFLAGSADGQRITMTVCDPLGREIEAAYGLIDGGETAIIEMALASGLELVADDELDPMAASTYGTGQLLQAALEQGARRFIIGLGGSATTDGGAGCMQALGVKLLDAHGEPVPPGGGGLDRLHTIDVSQLDRRWREVEVIVASDVDNPTLGERGAAYVYAPQKGASREQVKRLDDNLRHFFTLVHEQLGVDVRDVEGGGAAGAFSAGLMAFLGGEIQAGIDLILAHNQFTAHLPTADLVITGEGQMDAQTISGKGPIGVARLAREYDVPTVAIVGGLNVDDAVLHEAGVQAALPIVTAPMSLAEAITRADELVERAALRLGYVLRLM